MYPQYPRHWLNPAEALNLKEFFYLASCEISTRLEDNPHADERGLTDELVRVLTNKKTGLVSALQDRLGRSRSKIELTMHETSISDENLIGADLGIVLRLATDDLQYERSALFQAKRLHPEEEQFGPYCTYHLESAKARKQAEKMQRYNSASFFILYNPTPLPALSTTNEPSQDLEEVQERLVAHWLTYYETAMRRVEYATPPFAVPTLSRNFSSLSLDPSDGICVLPSSIVTNARPSSLRAKPLHRYTLSFTDFMVDDLIQGKVGDTTKEGIDIARGRNRKFEVRYSLGVELRSGRFFTGESLSPLFQ